MTLCVLYIEIRVSTVHMLSSSPYRSGERAQLVHYVPPGQVVAFVGFGSNHEEMESFATEEGARPNGYEWITYVYLKMRSHMSHVRGEPWQPCLQAWVNYP